MRTKLLLGGTAILCFALSCVAGHAQSKSRGPDLDAFMQQWDPDHDGTMSLDEVKKAADARFDTQARFTVEAGRAGVQPA